jgi:hypothetical protein
MNWKSNLLTGCSLSLARARALQARIYMRARTHKHTHRHTLNHSLTHSLTFSQIPAGTHKALVGVIFNTALGNLKRHIEGSNPSANAFKPAPGISRRGGLEAAQSPAEEARGTRHQETRDRHASSSSLADNEGVGFRFRVKL